VLAPLADADPRAIGPFRTTGRLGSGGMGTVYLGFGPDDRPVAVKVPTPALAGDPRFRARFRREVGAVQMIRSNSVATVVAADTEAESPWMATEYVQGTTLLDAVTDRGPLASRLVVAFAAGLADGLVATHAAGVVHRDLKPANVVLAWDGPKIIDFGVALTTQPLFGDSATDSDPDLTQAKTQFGQRLGTFVWMAPEQLRGETVGPPADVFAWGACVTYATAGHSPFRTPSRVETMGRILEGEPDLDGVPAELAGLVRAALAKDPQARPSATDLVSGLVHRVIRTPLESDEAVETVLTQWASQPPTPAATALPQSGSASKPSSAPRADPPTWSARPGAAAGAAGAGAGALDAPTERAGDPARRSVRGPAGGPPPAAETLNLPPVRGRQGQSRPGGPSEPRTAPERTAPERMAPERPAQGPRKPFEPQRDDRYRQGGGWTEESDLPTYIRPAPGAGGGSGAGRGDSGRGGSGRRDYPAAAGWAGERDQQADVVRAAPSTRMKALLAVVVVVVLASAVGLALALASAGGDDDRGPSVSETSLTATPPASASSSPSLSPSVSPSQSVEPTTDPPPSPRRTTRPPRPSDVRTTAPPPPTTPDTPDTPITDTQTPPTSPISTTPSGPVTGSVTTPPGSSPNPLAAQASRGPCLPGYAGGAGTCAP